MRRIPLACFVILGLGLGLEACQSAGPQAPAGSAAPAALASVGASGTSSVAPQAPVSAAPSSPAPSGAGAIASPAPAASASSPVALSPSPFATPDLEAIRRDFQGPNYVKVNAVPKVGNSAHAGAMNLYVTQEHRRYYAMSNSASFPPGAVVVKASEGGGGTKGTFAVMVKLPPGSDPEAGDWWYHEAINGSVVYAGGQGGGFCNSCHQPFNPDRMGGIPLFTGFTDRP